MTIASHLFSCYKFICYLVTVIKIMKYQLLGCRLLYYFCFYKLRIFYFFIIFLYCTTICFWSPVANFFITLPPLFPFLSNRLLHWLLMLGMVFSFFFYHNWMRQTIFQIGNIVIKCFYKCFEIISIYINKNLTILNPFWYYIIVIKLLYQYFTKA